MNFAVGVILMWTALGVMSLKPLKVWLPIGIVGSFLILRVLQEWGFTNEETSYGLLVGLIAGLVARWFFWSRKRSGRKTWPRRNSDSPNPQ